MSERAIFKEIDLARAMKAVKRAKERIGRIEIEPTGKIVIFPERDLSEDGAPNPWDDA